MSASGARGRLPTRQEQAAGWRAPGQDAGWLNPIRESFLLRLLVRKELRVRYRGSALGMVWSYVKPAVQFTVFYIALGVFLQLQRDTPAYAVYLFSGIVVINLFGEVFGNATRSITGNQALVSKIYLPSELFPWASMIVAMVHFLPQLVVLVIGALIFGWLPSTTAAIAFVLGVIILVVFTMGLGMLTGRAERRLPGRRELRGSHRHGRHLALAGAVPHLDGAGADRRHPLVVAVSAQPSDHRGGALPHRVLAVLAAGGRVHRGGALAAVAG